MRRVRDMDEKIRSNGHRAEHEEIPVSVNPYRDAVSGTRPREIVEFELNTDPYANMLPRVASVSRSPSEEDTEDSGRKRNPILVVVSILLVAILILPVMVEVFARLIH